MATKQRLTLAVEPPVVSGEAGSLILLEPSLQDLGRRGVVAGRVGAEIRRQWVLRGPVERARREQLLLRERLCERKNLVV